MQCSRVQVRVHTDFGEFAGGLVDDLVAAEPEAAVEEADVEHVVKVGLRERVFARDAEQLNDQLADQLPVGGADRVVRRPFEGRVEWEHWPRAAHAVASQVQVLHRMQIGQVELDARAVRVAREPHKRIRSLSARSGSAAFDENDLKVYAGIFDTWSLLNPILKYKLSSILKNQSNNFIKKNFEVFSDRL